MACLVHSFNLICVYGPNICSCENDHLNRISMYNVYNIYCVISI